MTLPTIPKPVREALKELLRVAALAVLPVIIGGLNTTSGAVEINWRIVAVVAVVTILRAIDKYFHKWGKENNDENISKGLTRF